MKKKGFTLMELLAVIVILAVLALLVIPITTNLIKTSKQQAFKISVGQVSDNISFHYAKDWLLEGMSEDKVFNFDTGDNLGLLTLAGQLPTGGTITINPQGKISINVNNGVYCAVKTIEQDNIQVGEIVNGTCEITGEEVDTCPYRIGYTWDFDYISTGEDRSQEFSVPCEGNYKLEVWGAQGGLNGGYGGYSTGIINLEKDETLYVNVGGTSNNCNASYNGGGAGSTIQCSTAGAGGGATHIATVPGELKNLSAYKDTGGDNISNEILIVAAGGAGMQSNFSVPSGHAGGFKGVNGSGAYKGYGATQTGTGSSSFPGGFGYGGAGEYYNDNYGGSGGGAGWYGGSGGAVAGNNGNQGAGGGGSSYIGNTNLKNKFMYCFDCETSTDESTYTITGKTVSTKAITSSAKKGNGYAKIQYIGKNNTEKIIACVEGMSWDFNYKEENGNGVEQTFTPTCTGYYKLEVWGAGSSSFTISNKNFTGGYGGYSIGTTKLTKDVPIYINVGEFGKSCSNGTSNTSCTVNSSYNGGAGCTSLSGYSSNIGYLGCGAGGGATHIAYDSGLLSTFENKQDKLLIVAGGGGGANAANYPYNYGNGGSGGGIAGNNNINGGEDFRNLAGGTQTTGAYFGQGKNGGGGGYYGGYGGISGSGGGSGYIGYNLLYKKAMYCYNCEDSSDISTNTKSTKNVSENSESQYAKIGNGYAKITYIGETINTSINSTEGEYWNYFYKEENGNGVEQTFIAPVTGIYKLEVWGAQGGGNSSYIGGYGGYSTGIMTLNKNSTIFINVGEQGDHCTGTSCSIDGGYNGGGAAKYYSPCRSNQLISSGGGATHIALSSGLLTEFDPTLENNIHNKLLIVAGGGGGGNWCNDSNYANGGHGGGFTAVSSINKGAPDWTSNGGPNAVGATQYNGYSFGLGEGSSSSESIGAGGGYYGGKNSIINGAGGGSGYIGNDLLSNKHMYCYNCTQSAASNINTYTISNGTNSCKNSFAISDCAKEGHGYARITLIEIK